MWAFRPVIDQGFSAERFLHGDGALELAFDRRGDGVDEEADGREDQPVGRALRVHDAHARRAPIGRFLRELLDRRGRRRVPQQRDDEERVQPDLRGRLVLDRLAADPVHARHLGRVAVEDAGAEEEGERGGGER